MERRIARKIAKAIKELDEALFSIDDDRMLEETRAARNELVDVLYHAGYELKKDYRIFYKKGE